MSTERSEGGTLSGVAVTAVGVALARAEESRRSDRLFADPLASEFVADANLLATRFTGGDAAGASDGWAFMLHTVAIRTPFLDGYVEGAAAGGCRQVVLLAAGLDARAVRLDWPLGTRLFEVDQPEMLAFKERVLRRAAGTPSCRRHVVATDLTGDWAGALVAAGFRPQEQTAWLVEGLLPALSGDDSDRLMAEITRLSAAGSRLALDHMPMLPAMRATLDTMDPSLPPLWKGGPAEAPGVWLGRHGWDSEVVVMSDAARSYGRPAEPYVGAPPVLLATARRTETAGPGVQTLVVHEREDETTMRFNDEPPVHPPDPREFRRPATLGDTMTMHVPLRRSEDTRPAGAPVGDHPPVGSFQARCTVTRPGPTRFDSAFLCSCVIELPEGTLTKEVLWSPSVFARGKVGLRLVGAITGGTGAYAGATGEFRLIGISQNSAKLVYRFRTLGTAWPPDTAQGGVG